MVNSSEKPPINTAKPAGSPVLAPPSRAEIERYQPVLDEHDRLEEARLTQLQEEVSRDQRAREQRVLEEHNRRIAKLIRENPGFKPPSDED